MIRRMVRFLLPVVAMTSMVMLGALPAAAQLVDEEGVGRLTIGGALGFQLTAMQDVNDNVDVVNRFLSLDLIRDLDHLDVGLLTSLDVRYRLGRTPPEEPGETVSFMNRLSVGFAWGGLNCWSDFDVAKSTTRFFSRATTYYPYVLYHFPFLEEIAPRTQLYAGGGPIFLKAGRVEWSLSDNTTNNFLVDGDLAELSGVGKASGTGSGFTLQGGGSFMLNSRFSVALDFGYRTAKITDLSLDEADGGPPERFPGGDGGEDVTREPGDWAIIDFFLRDPSGEYDGRTRGDVEDDGGCADCPLYYRGGPLEVDYSGAFSTISFRVHF